MPSLTIDVVEKCKKSEGSRSRDVDNIVSIRHVPPLTSNILKKHDRQELFNNKRLNSVTPSTYERKTMLRIQKFVSDGSIPKLRKEEQAQAKLEWAAKYTSIHNLRQRFGLNRNKFWGDFDSKTTRKLHHTLLPRALLGLYEVGLWSSDDLAPLAFEARLAAKKYARERCHLPGRIASMVYDGFRAWKTWVKWSVEDMTWEQIWNKYETQVL